tara:strand:- start:7533 stop:7829 length:297 start_codon:yes stop_codon:yes gene_type:complete
MKTSTFKMNNGIFTLIAAAGLCALFSIDASAMPPSKTTPAVAHPKVKVAANSAATSKRSKGTAAISKAQPRPQTIGLTLSTKATPKATPYHKRKLTRP